MDRFKIPVPVEVAVDEIAGAQMLGVSERVSEAVMLAMSWLEEGGHPLNDLQKQELIRTAILCVDGLEAELREDIERHLETTVKIALERNRSTAGQSEEGLEEAMSRIQDLMDRMLPKLEQLEANAARQRAKVTSLVSPEREESQ